MQGVGRGGQVPCNSDGVRREYFWMAYIGFKGRSEVVAIYRIQPFGEAGGQSSESNVYLLPVYLSCCIFHHFIPLSQKRRKNPSHSVPQICQTHFHIRALFLSYFPVNPVTLYLPATICPISLLLPT